MSLLRVTGTWFFITGLLYFVNVTYSVVLARWLGPVARGEYAVLLAVVGMLISFLSLGLGVMGRVEAAQRPENARRVQSNLLLFTVFCALLSFGIYRLVTLFPEWVKLKDMNYLPLPFLLFPFILYADYWETFAQGLNWFKEINFMRVFKSLLELTLLTALLVLAHRGLPGALLTFSVSTGLLFVFKVFVAYRKASGPADPHLKLLADHLSHGWKLSVARFAIGMQTSAAVLILTQHVTKESLGYFAVANALALQVGIFWGTFAVTSSPHIASTNRLNSERLVAFLNRTLVTGGVVLFVVAVALIQPALLLLYGKAYVSAGIPFSILLMGLLAGQTTEINAQYIVAQHAGSELSMKLSILNGCIGFPLLLLLTPRFGMNGAAAALGGAALLNAVLHHIMVRGMMHCRPADLLFLTREDFQLVREKLKIRKRPAVS